MSEHTRTFGYWALVVFTGIITALILRFIDKPTILIERATEPHKITIEPESKGNPSNNSSTISEVNDEIIKDTIIQTISKSTSQPTMSNGVVFTPKEKIPTHTISLDQTSVNPNDCSQAVFGDYCFTNLSNHEIKLLYFKVPYNYQGYQFATIQPQQHQCLYHLSPGIWQYTYRVLDINGMPHDIGNSFQVEQCKTKEESLSN